MAGQGYAWQFHVHHIFPEKVYDTWGSALEAAGFFEQAKGNKIALFASSEMAGIVRSLINSGDTLYLDAGFGGSVHPGREIGLSHKAYTDFALARVGQIAATSEPAAQQAQFTKLHSFLSDVSEGRFANLGVESGMAAFESAWSNYDPSPAELNQHFTDFDPTITDAGGQNNVEERLDRVRDLIETAHDAGNMTESQYIFHTGVLDDNITRAGGNFSSIYNNISGVGVAALIDIQTNMGTIQPSLKSQLASSVANFITSDEGSVSIGSFDDFMSSIDKHGDLISGLFTSGKMPGSLSELGTAVSNAIASNIGNMIVGAGGGAIGDAVEFLNASYESIKTGITTGDWSDFQQNVATYGVAAAVSAVIAAGTIAAAGALLGPAAAAAVAAGWAAYGLVDALTNGAELLGKLLDDWRDGTLGDILTAFFDNPPLSPLVLDLDGDGLELVALQNSSTSFDLDADGFAELTGWVARDDALLAIDLDGDGRIDNGSELFGDQTGFAHGFLALAEHDTNSDGVIDAQDDTFAELLLWRDANGDGVSQSGELKTLSDMGIASISVSATATNHAVQGHDILWQSGFTRADGSTGTVSDVFFQVDPIRSTAMLPDGFVFAPDVFKLPLLQGAGQVASTPVALTNDPALKAQFTALLAQATAGDISGFLTGFESFVYVWAGVSDIEPDSRGPALDARKVAFLEAILGREYQQDDYAYFANPGPVAAVILDWEVSEIIEAMAAQFLAQSTISNAQLTATSAATYEAAIAGHLLNALPSSKSGATYEWVAEILADAIGGTGLGLSQAETLLHVMRHRASDLGAYEQAIIDGYIAAGIDPAIAAQTAALLVAEHGYYVTDGPGDELVPDGIMTDHAIYVADPSGDDTLQGGAGNDVLVGREGNDTYVWGTGMGNDVIDEETGNTTDVDRLILVNLTAKDVRFTAMIEPGFDRDVMIKVTDTGEWLILDDQLAGNAFEAIEEIQFADGQIMLEAEFEALAKVWSDGTEGDDVLIGHVGGDGINGRSGNDTLAGGDGSDTYLYARGDGNDTINESAPGFNTFIDKLVFTDINPASVSLQRSGNNLTLVIAESSAGAGDGGSILLNNEFAAVSPGGGTPGVEQVQFANGTVWTTAQMAAMVIDQAGTAGNNTINGFDAYNDTLNGRQGNDTLAGGDGSDTYLYARGDGNDTINESAPGFNTFIDKLVFTDINPASVSLQRSGNNLTLVIAESSAGAGDGGSILLNNEFAAVSPGGGTPGVEQVQFANGTVWTTAQMAAMVIDQAGTAGNNTINGFDAYNDTLNGRQGNDTLAGGDGSDTYLYARGDGNDTINESAPGFNTFIDKLVFTDINPASVSLQRSGNNLMLVIAESSAGAGDGGSILLNNEFAGNNTGVEQVQFADGTLWSRGDMLTKVLDQAGTPGNDTINGTTSGEVIRGGFGNDTLAGGDGSDTYLYARGDGNDTINESAPGFNTFIDKLVFTDINPASVSLQRSGNNLMLVIAESSAGAGDGGSILLNNEFAAVSPGGGTPGVEQVQFANGTVWTTAQMAAMVIDQAGTAGNNTINGFDAYNDTLNGRQGNDTLAGGDGSDTYLYARGDGNDTINESAPGFNTFIDKLVFTDINPASVSLQRSGNNLTLVIAESSAGAGDGGSILLNNEFAAVSPGGGTPGVEQVQFANGTVWTTAQMAAMVIDQAGTAGNNTINGFDAYNDTLNGRQGNDTLAGGDGSDTYLYARGDGNDTINESAPGFNTFIDKLVFTDINPASVSLQRSGNNLTLVIAESSAGAGDGGSILLNNEFAAVSPGGGTPGVEQVQFANGTVWTTAQMAAMVIDQAGTAGNNTINGFDAYNDTLNGRQGNDTLAGGDGSDTYLYARGDGNDTINESAPGFNTFIDKLVFTDINPASVSLQRSGNNLTLVIAESSAGAGDGGSILLNNEFAAVSPGGGTPGVEQVQFANGTVWTTAQMAAMVIDQAGTAGNNTINGFDAYNDTLNGRQGNDTLAGGDGSDTYLYARGDGNDTINESAPGFNTFIDKLVFTDINASDLRVMREGSDLILKVPAFDGSGSIRLTQQLAGTAGVEQVTMADGTVWSRSTLIANVLGLGDANLDGIVSGTTAADIIDDNSGSLTLAGGAGSDTYVFGAGYGNDTVAETTGATDVDIVQLVGLNVADVALTRAGSNLMITVTATGEALTVVGHFTDAAHGIEQIRFADASTVDRAGISVATDTAPSALTVLAPLSFGTLATSGSATALGGNTYELTPDSVSKLGAARGTVDLSNDVVWDTQMYFGASDAGAHGIGFVLAAANATGTQGSFGVDGPNTFGLRFDTYVNSGEPNSDFGQFLLNGAGVGATTNFANIENGAWHDVKIIWNAAAKTLSYSLDGVAVGTYTYDVPANILGGGTIAGFGFGARTGGATNSHQVKLKSISAGVDRLDVDLGTTAGTIVAELVAADQDGGTLTYALVDAAGALVSDSLFEIIGNKLAIKTGMAVNASGGSTHDLLVKATDPAGHASVFAVGVDLDLDPDGNGIIDGTSGNDVIHGDDGVDYIAGGAGADSLYGGAGNDVFVFFAASDSISGSRDRIEDFTAGDRIKLLDIDAKDGVAGDQAFVLDTNASFSIGEIRQTVVGSDLLLEMNVDADSTPEMSILIVSRTTNLAAGDFIF